MKYGNQCQLAQEALTLFFDTQRPADQVLRRFIKERPYIGSKDRQSITTLYYGVLRDYFKLCIYLEGAKLPKDPRRLLLSSIFIAQGLDHGALAALFPQSPHPWSALSQSDMENLALLKQAFEALHMSAHITQRQGFPETLHALFAQNLSVEHLPGLLQVLQEEAPTDIRINALKTSRDQVAALLQGNQWASEPTPFSPFGLRLLERYPLTSTQWFRDGLYEIQDEGAQLIGLLADAQPGQRVLDYCAGAGGKTLLLGALMRNKGTLVATDVHSKRLAEASLRLRRAGLSNYVTKHLEKDKTWMKRQKQKFDLVLADVPCSGTGTWRRHPDAKIKFSLENFSSLLEKQEQILKNAAAYVKPGGRLIYATCSILAQENEKQITRFLKNNPDFSLIPAAAVLKNTVTYDKLADITKDGHLFLLPQTNGPDGFFAAILDKME